MTEPGRTSGFRVADHIRVIKEYAGLTPDYVLVNAQRIDPETTRIYAAAHQTPVYLDPSDYEEVATLPGDVHGQRGVIIEGVWLSRPIYRRRLSSIQRRLIIRCRVALCVCCATMGRSWRLL